MNAAPLVSLSRAGDWARRVAIFWPAKGFPPVRLLHSFGNILRGHAVYRARAYRGQPRDRGGRQDTVGRAPDGGPVSVRDVRVDDGLADVGRRDVDGWRPGCGPYGMIPG